MLQNLTEIALIGAAGGLLGIGLAQAGLTAVRAGISQAAGSLFSIDWTIVGMSIAISVIAPVLAGLYPAWRACLIAPATELKIE